MKKENFVSLILGVIGGLLFALGMCMCLIPEWNAFSKGAAVGALGLLILIVMLIARRKMQGKPPVRLTAKTVSAIALGVAGALVLGLGMCMAMVWNLLVWGVIVGIIGIALLLCLIPLCVGLK